MTMNFDYQKAATMNNILTRLESLEQSRAQNASAIDAVITALTDRICDLEKRNQAFANGYAELKNLIAMQDTAIESLDAQYKRIAISQDNDRGAMIREHIEYTQKLTDLREATATQLETMHKRIDAQRNLPGWVHYVDANDLQKIIDERITIELQRLVIDIDFRLKPR